MTLPEGTTIEIAMPTPDDTDLRGVHAYRVRGPDGTIELSALSELADHLPEQGIRPPGELSGDAGHTVTAHHQGRVHTTNSATSDAAARRRHSLPHNHP